MRWRPETGGTAAPKASQCPGRRSGVSGRVTALGGAWEAWEGLGRGLGGWAIGWLSPLRPGAAPS